KRRHHSKPGPRLDPTRLHWVTQPGSDNGTEPSTLHSSTRVALPPRGSSKLPLAGEQQPEELHDEKGFRHRSVCYVANGWRDRCAGPIQQGPDADYRHGGEPPKDPVRRLPTFIQTPTARSTCIGSPAPRCALGAAPGGQHAATRSEHPSTA